MPDKKSLAIVARSSVISVTTASKLALGANALRISALVQNDSDTVMYIKLGAAAVANEGIRLNASGGAYEIGATNYFPGEIFIICSASKSAIVTEISYSETAQKGV